MLIQGWSKERPTVSGDYWLYGRIWGSGVRKFYMVKVRGEGRVLSCEGNHLSTLDIQEAVWTPVIYPDPPVGG